VTAEQLTELGGAVEGVGDQLTGRQGDGRLDPAPTLSDEVRAGRERAGVELGEPIERIAVRLVGGAQGDRGLPGGPAVLVLSGTSMRLRHGSIMAIASI
jgi:hypothetical protein